MKGELFKRYHFRSDAAFSLLEILAVLAILAILAAALVPAVIKQADFAAQNLETTNLVTFANAFQQGATRQRYLPDSNTWYTFIATNAGWQTNAVVTNPRNNARVFLIDPSIALGVSLPYSQDGNPSGLASAPTSVRFMIVSSMAQTPLPSGMVSGSGTAADFNNLWATPDNTIPSGTPSWNWNNFTQGSDVQIQRINLSSMFHHLVLTDFTNDLMQWTIGTTNIAGGGTGGNGVNGYFLAATPIGLLRPGTIVTVQMLLQDSSYTYQCGIWRANPPISHQNIVDVFTNLTKSTNVIGPFTPTLICSDMINYMANYAAYANSGYSNVSNRNALQASQVTLSNNLQSLDH